MDATQDTRGNELGFISPYQQFLDGEGLPVVNGFLIADIANVQLTPWERMGGTGAYLNLDGTEGVNDAYISEIAPGESLKPQKHMFEELEGPGSGWPDDHA